MTNSPACHVSPSRPMTRPTSPALGGNLALPVSSRQGHFLFQAPDNIGADFTDPNEAEFLPVYSAAWRARRDSRRSPAKSRTSPFPHINDISHSGFSVGCTSGDRPE